MRLHKAHDIVLTVVFVGIFGCLWLMGFVFGNFSPDYGYILVGLGISLFGLIKIIQSVNKQVAAEFARSRFMGIGLQPFPLIFEHIRMVGPTIDSSLLLDVFLVGLLIITYVMFSFARYKSVMAGDNDDEDAYIGRL